MNLRSTWPPYFWFHFRLIYEWLGCCSAITPKKNFPNKFIYLDPLSNSKIKIFPIWNNHNLKHFVPFSSTYEFQIIKFIHFNIFISNLFSFPCALKIEMKKWTFLKTCHKKCTKTKRRTRALRVCLKDLSGRPFFWQSVLSTHGEKIEAAAVQLDMANEVKVKRKSSISLDIAFFSTPLGLIRVFQIVSMQHI